MKAGKSWTLLIFGLSIIVILVATAALGGIASGLQTFPAGSTPYGLPYGQWTAKWWTWAMSIPSSINPLADTTGINCAQGQTGPVWFLAGTTGGHAERTCTIPTGKAILFPVVNTECSYAEFPKLTSESALRQCAVSEQNNVQNAQAKVDGVLLQASQMPRVQSPLFSFVFPKNNIFGAPAGPSQSVSDGIWVFLPNLAPGAHTIEFKAIEGSFTTTSAVNSVQDVLYHLTVH